MESVKNESLQQVLASVVLWPPADRITLARKILETVEQPSIPQSRGLRGEEVIDLLEISQPAPDDAECQRIVAEERFRKYGT